VFFPFVALDCADNVFREVYARRRWKVPDVEGAKVDPQNHPGKIILSKENAPMKGKLLIVEDEPIVALDLKQEVESLGCEVLGVAESADEAMVAAGVCRPDLALMDVRIVGSVDGIQTAGLLRAAYRVPVVFLTSYSDETTIARAAREMPYGYLTKPFQSGELKATLQVALHKARVDAQQSMAHREMTAAVDGMREGVLMVSSEGRIQFMNAAAETLTGWSLAKIKGRHLNDILNLSDGCGRTTSLMENREDAISLEEFGWTLHQPSGIEVLVDVSLAPLASIAGPRKGFVITVRDAAERLRAQAMEETIDESHSFDQTPQAMVQLDGNGCIVRVNQALLKESGVTAESLVGRSLTGLSMDPDPRIARDLMHMLMRGGTFLGTARPRTVN
jgi:PAS domain S-box-containing protein